MVNGSRVAERRDELGWTQFELAVKCQELIDQHKLDGRHSVSLSSIQRVEAMRQDLSLTKAGILAKVLGLDVGELLLPFEASA